MNPIKEKAHNLMPETPNSPLEVLFLSVPASPRVLEGPALEKAAHSLLPWQGQLLNPPPEAKQASLGISEQTLLEK